jgi:hypothetical protein
MGKLGEHLGVTGKIVATGEQSGLIYRRGDDAVDVTGRRKRHGALDGETTEPSADSGGVSWQPRANHFINWCAGSAGTDHHNVTALADLLVSERLGNDLRSNPAGITHGHGKTCFHQLQPE